MEFVVSSSSIRCCDSIAGAFCTFSVLQSLKADLYAFVIRFRSIIGCLGRFVVGSWGFCLFLVSLRRMVDRKLFKTKLCILYQRGHCSRPSCSFAHGESELRHVFGSYNGKMNFFHQRWFGFWLAEWRREKFTLVKTVFFFRIILVWGFVFIVGILSVAWLSVELFI